MLCRRAWVYEAHGVVVIEYKFFFFILLFYACGCSHGNYRVVDMCSLNALSELGSMALWQYNIIRADHVGGP